MVAELRSVSDKRRFRAVTPAGGRGVVQQRAALTPFTRVTRRTTVTSLPPLAAAKPRARRWGRSAARRGRSGEGGMGLGRPG